MTYARIKPDRLSPYYNFMARSDPRQDPEKYVNLDGAPMTIRLNGGAGQLKLTSLWLARFAALNTAKAQKYNWRTGSGWHNRGEKGRVESLTFRENVVQIDHTEGDRAYIKHHNNLGKPPVITYASTPQLIHSFTTVRRDGSTNIAPCGNLYVFPIGKKNEVLWIDKNELEFFYPAPFSVVVRIGSLLVRATPDGPSTGTVKQGDVLDVTDYAVRGPNVWGLIDGGWIALQHVTIDGLFTTDWEMSVSPPKTY